MSSFRKTSVQLTVFAICAFVGADNLLLAQVDHDQERSLHAEVATLQNKVRAHLNVREFSEAEALLPRLMEISKIRDSNSYRFVNLFYIAKEFHEVTRISVALKLLEVKRQQVMEDRQQGQHSQSADLADDSEYRSTLHWLALAQVEMGRLDEAEKCIADLDRLRPPNYMSPEQKAALRESFKDIPFFDPDQMERNSEDGNVNTAEFLKAKMLLQARKGNAVGVHGIVKERLKRSAVIRAQSSGILGILVPQSKGTISEDPLLASAALPGLAIVNDAASAGEAIEHSWKMQMGEIPVGSAGSVIANSNIHRLVNQDSHGENNRTGAFRKEQEMAILLSMSVASLDAKSHSQSAEWISNLKALNHEDQMALNLIWLNENDAEAKRLQSELTLARRSVIAQRYAGIEVNSLEWAHSPDGMKELAEVWQRLARTGGTPDEVSAALAKENRKLERPAQMMDRVNREIRDYLEQQRTENPLASWEKTIRDNVGRDLLSNRWVPLSRIRAELESGEYLIDIGLTNYFDKSAKADEPLWKGQHYFAWIIPPADSGDVIAVDLGDSDRIDAAVRDFHKTMEAAGAPDGTIKTLSEREAEKLIRKNCRELTELIWNPLAVHLKDARSLTISPDASLWLVPFETLLIDEDRYLVESYPVRYLMSSRDVVTGPGQIPTTAPVIFADPDFGAQTLPAKQNETKAQPGAIALRGTAPAPRQLLPDVGPLPGTATEAEFITPSLERLAGQKPLLFTRSNATETRLFELHSPHTLILATHGFILDSRLAATRPEIEDPFQCSGILLADCNEHTGQQDDGVLTAFEAMNLDLTGTNLVVLSACQSGLGRVNDGEGVAGLRQAFFIAGAKSVMATLWDVPDRESAQMMNQFFINTAEGQSCSTAIRNARVERIRNRRERFGAAHPFFWAAYTLTGDSGGR